MKGLRIPRVQRFFEEGAGDRLMDPACHPPAITEFLAAEQQMLSDVADCVDVLVEVGCMDGRNLGWAVAHGKRYLGVDLVQRHIATARRAAEERGLCDDVRFVAGDARRIDTVVEPALRDLAGARALLFFPFNSFGTMPGPSRALRSIHASGLPFFISSYQPTALATACRASYYQRCGYRALAVSEDARGVWFTSPEGLRSVAYDPRYLLGLCTASGLSAAPVSWAKINQAYATPELAARWEATRYAAAVNGNGHGRRMARI
ncbi:MAG TPA: class I SAM-dependent methyltransferase [Longimicrobium sp.]|nr:class I SAM-dependent methyltransferase [Longimicrobium sp.]